MSAQSIVLQAGTWCEKKKQLEKNGKDVVVVLQLPSMAHRKLTKWTA
jgi:hypothetical protein